MGSPSGVGALTRPGLAYAHLNLRCNPFGELDLAQRAELAVVDVDHVVRRLGQPGYAVQFMGERGQGKTTHLLAIRRQLPGTAYVHVAETGRTGIPEGPVLLIDEIQRLGSGQRRHLFRPERSLALGTHEDFCRELGRAGFEVETVAVAEAVDAVRLREILARRIEWARRGPGPVPEVSLETARALLERFGGDIRAVEWHLYDWIQTLGDGHVQV